MTPDQWAGAGTLVFLAAIGVGLWGLYDLLLSAGAYLGGSDPDPGLDPETRPVPPAFVCPDCGARSWHPEDRRHGWCGACKAYTGRPAGLDLPAEAADPPRRSA